MLSSNRVRAAGQSACADWTIGEDVFLPADAVPGFRNMGDPEEDNDPDDCSARPLGSADRGFVHSNSAISNHAFFLLVNGGKNASCAAPSTHDAEQCGPGEPTVTGIGLRAAGQIMFAGLHLAPGARDLLSGSEGDRGECRGDLRRRLAAARIDHRSMGRGGRAHQLLSLSARGPVVHRETGDPAC